MEQSWITENITKQTRIRTIFVTFQSASIRATNEYKSFLSTFLTRK